MTQYGFKTETTPGVTVTPDKFLPILDGESLDIGVPIQEAGGTRAGAKVRRMEDTNGGLIEVGGSVPLEFSTVGTTSILRHMFGGKVTTSLGGGRYRHVFTAGTLVGLSSTQQVGVNMDGTVIPKTITGAKVGSWAVGGEEGAFLTLGRELIAQRGQIGTRTVTDAVTDNGEYVLASASADFTDADIDKDVSGTGIAAGSYITGVASDGSTATLSDAMTADGTGVTVVIGKALATASYPSPLSYWKMYMARLSIDGSNVPIYGFEVTGDNKLVRDYPGGSQNSQEIRENGDEPREYGGTFNLAFSDLAQVNRYRGGIPFEWEILATNPHNTDTLKFEGYSRYDTTLAPMAQQARVMIDAPFRCFGDTDDASAIKATLENTDASAD